MKFLAIILLWIIFNGKVTAEVFGTGILFSFLMMMLVNRVKSARQIQSNSCTIKKIVMRVDYYVLLVKEIIKANIQVMDIILTPSKINITPRIIKLETEIKNTGLNVLLANSVTLTPGTITSNMSDNKLEILVLDKSFAEGIEEMPFIKKLEKMDD